MSRKYYSCLCFVEVTRIYLKYICAHQNMLMLISNSTGVTNGTGTVDPSTVHTRFLVGLMLPNAQFRVQCYMDNRLPPLFPLTFFHLRLLTPLHPPPKDKQNKTKHDTMYLKTIIINRPISCQVFICESLYTDRLFYPAMTAFTD